MDDIKLALVGAGNIAREHLKAIEHVESMSVVGITSRTETKAQTLAQEFKIRSVYKNLDELIDDCQPDGVMVLVSLEQLFPVIKNLIKYRIPFFTEKPPGLVPEQTRILSDLANTNSVLNMVGFNRRYYSIFNEGWRVINERGKLLGIAIEGHERYWNLSEKLSEIVRRNWLYANSIHTIDLLRFFGGEPSTVNVLSRSHLLNTSDQFTAVMEFESGTLGSYISFWHSPGGWSVRLFGEGVTVEFKPLEQGRWFDTNLHEHKIVSSEEDRYCKPGFYRQMVAYGQMIREGHLKWPGLDLASSLKTMNLAKQFISNQE